MGRNLTSNQENASEASVVRTIALVRLDYASDDVLVASTPFNVKFDWDGDTNEETFLGVGELGNISSIEEAAEIQPYSVSLNLSGVPTENLSTALGEDYQGRDVRIWLALVDENYDFIDDPFLFWRGRMDTQEVDLVKRTIDVTAHSRLRDWDRARVSRLTNEEQQSRYPGDRGLEFVAQTVEKELVWGQS